jgi:glutamate racemase
LSGSSTTADRPIGSSTNADRPIGVFDSSIGGLSVLRALRAELPHEDFLYFDDSGHAPYGERGEAHALARSRAITQSLCTTGIKALVIACNTATAAAVAQLRTEYPDLPIIGVEPALKPALAASRGGRIGVMATRGTLASAKFAALLSSLASQAEFALQPCDGLAEAIDRIAATGERTTAEALCRRYTEAMGSIDTLVLGCTHYVLVQDLLARLLGPEVTLVSNGEPVARQTRRVLTQRGLLKIQGRGTVRFDTTGSPAALRIAVKHWLPEAGDRVRIT